MESFQPTFCRFVDAKGRPFEYAVVRHPGARGLVVHCSAFFGAWGEQRAYREVFQGYFHRLRMLGSSAGHNWLFLCDAHGAFSNGTYYTGARGDLFVERAVTAIVAEELQQLGLDPSSMVTMGSSMGATGALVLGLRFGAAGVVAITPHVDLDVAAARCGRFEEVAFVTSDGDPGSTASRAVTRRVRSLLSDLPPGASPPKLYVQVCADDVGVYEEQVLPLVHDWQARGGSVALDVRPRGGHTSDFATRDLLLDAAGRLMDGTLPDVAHYQQDPQFAASARREPVVSRVRRRLKLRTRARRVTRLVHLGSRRG